jgi:hypothetical protein
MSNLVLKLWLLFGAKVRPCGQDVFWFYQPTCSWLFIGFLLKLGSLGGLVHDTLRQTFLLELSTW